MTKTNEQANVAREAGRNKTTPIVKTGMLPACKWSRSSVADAIRAMRERARERGEKVSVMRKPGTSNTYYSDHADEVRMYQVPRVAR